MKGGKQPHGFTIVEVMIFLAISSVIFVGALDLLGGKQNQTAFSTSVSQVTSQLQSIIGNVADGFYNSSQNFKCTPSASGPSVKNVGGGNLALGTNLGCVFIGEVVQFYTNSGAANTQDYVVYPVVGNQYDESLSLDPPVQATNLTQAIPLALYTAGSSNVDESQTTPLPYGIVVHNNGLTYTDDKVNSDQPNPIGSIGFFTTFNGYTSGSNTSTLQSGSQSVQLIPIPGSHLSDSKAAAAGEIDSLGGEVNSLITDPSGGVGICLDSGTNGQSALITIGGANSPTSVVLTHFSQKGCTDA
jgi:type II secretory pathway pseudopilin PulG